MNDETQATVGRPGPWAYRARWIPEVAAVLAIVAATIWAFTGTGLDVQISRCFYEAGAVKPFHHHLQFPWKFLYDFVDVPIVALAAAAVFGLWRAGRGGRWRRYRAHFALVIAALALGPGVAVNLIFKDHWGRPRPRHVQEFGGRWEYRDAVDRGTGGKGKSFPCGHSSAGYFFTLFYFLFRRRRPGLAWAMLAFGLAFGTLLGMGRVIAGSHFASDVVWSGIIVFSVSLILYYFVFNIPGREDAPRKAPPDARADRWALAGGVAVVLAIGVGTFLATPYYGDIVHELALPASRAPLRLDLAVGEISLLPGADRRLLVQGQAEAFGMFGSRVRRTIGWEGEGADTAAVFRIRATGFFTDASVPVAILIPTGAVTRVRVNIEGADVAAFGPPEFAASLGFAVRGGSLTLPTSWRPAPPVVVPDPAVVRYADLPPPRPPSGGRAESDDDR